MHSWDVRSGEHEDYCKKIIEKFFQHYNLSGKVDPEAIRIFADLVPFARDDASLITQNYASAADFIERFLADGANDRGRFLEGRFSHFDIPILRIRAKRVF